MTIWKNAMEKSWCGRQKLSIEEKKEMI